MARCEVCFRHCVLEEGQIGLCGARKCEGGKVVSDNYGKITSLALDPIEKKPLYHFHPGSNILSVGSYGCNLRCPFCQNSEISWSERAFAYRDEARCVTPKVLADTAEQYQSRGNIGIAFTYNEPLIGYEFVRDTAKLVREKGMLNVLVSNGTAEPWVLDELAPYIDAMNIDLKGFTETYYSKTLCGSLEAVKEFISRAVKVCHVELTTLIVPGENDKAEEMRALTQWVASLKDSEGRVIGKSIPLHVSRFFPRFRMTDRPPTDVGLVYRLADIARERLDYVYTGNC